MGDSTVNEYICFHVGNMWATVRSVSYLVVGYLRGQSLSQHHSCQVRPTASRISQVITSWWDINRWFSVTLMLQSSWETLKLVSCDRNEKKQTDEVQYIIQNAAGDTILGKDLLKRLWHTSNLESQVWRGWIRVKSREWLKKNERERRT